MGVQEVWGQIKQKLREQSEAEFWVKVMPSAAQTKLKSVMADGTLKVAIAAPAQRLKANQALKKFIANQLNLKEDQVEIKIGISSRRKLVKIKI